MAVEIKGKRLVFTRQQIADKVSALAQQISQDYQGKNPILIGVLKGAFMFLADLTRHISIPFKIDFVRVASYGAKDYSTGEIKLTKDVELPIKGEHVLIVEDIVDIGYTLRFLLDHIAAKGPKSLKLCALINKLERRKVEIPIDYVGFTLDKGFLVGYGLDFNEMFRCLPEIYELIF